MPRVDSATASKNHNPNGRNQYDPVASVEDPELRNALIQLHREGITSNRVISELLRTRYNIIMKEHTVKRRRAALQLFSSKKTTRELPEDTKTQMVLTALAEDPLQQHGPASIRRNIAFQTGQHLTRDYISNVMHQVAPAGFHARKPVRKEFPQLNMDYLVESGLTGSN